MAFYCLFYFFNSWKLAEINEYQKQIMLLNVQLQNLNHYLIEIIKSTSLIRISLLMP